MLKLKRVYEQYAENDGYRILIDRLWPRGLSKEKAHIDMWVKNIAPSTKLRQWFRHDPTKWDEFKKRYQEELHENTQAVSTVVEILKKGNVTMVYGAKDTEHNDAVVLKEYLETKHL